MNYSKLYNNSYSLVNSLPIKILIFTVALSEILISTYVYIYDPIPVDSEHYSLFVIQFGIVLIGFLFHYLWLNIRFNNFNKRAYDLKKLPPTGHSIYLGYDKFLLEDLTGILRAYENLYKFIYYVSITEDFKELKNDRYLEFVNEELLRHPKSKIEFSSLHTGGSIVFKSKTGWLPKVYLENGNYVVEAPKGLRAFIFTGIVLTGIIELGNNVQEFLRSDLEREKLELEVEILKRKFEEMPEEGLREFQKRIDEFKFEISKDNIQSIRFYNKPLN